MCSGRRHPKRARSVCSTSSGSARQSQLGAAKSVTSKTLGYDFLPFYTAGTFAREGRFEELYNLDAVRQFEQETARQAGMENTDILGPWWNPPFYAMEKALINRLAISVASELSAAGVAMICLHPGAFFQCFNIMTEEALKERPWMERNDRDPAWAKLISDTERNLVNQGLLHRIERVPFLVTDTDNQSAPDTVFQSLVRRPVRCPYSRVAADRKRHNTPPD